MNALQNGGVALKCVSVQSTGVIRPSAVNVVIWFVTLTRLACVNPLPALSHCRRAPFALPPAARMPPTSRAADSQPWMAVSVPTYAGSYFFIADRYSFRPG